MEWHKLCGHFSTVILLPTIILRFYWKDITQDAKTFRKYVKSAKPQK